MHLAPLPVSPFQHYKFLASPRGAKGDPTVKLIIYLVIGVAVALVVLRFLNSRKPPRQ
jgi:hypothetical protein